ACRTHGKEGAPIAVEEACRRRGEGQGGPGRSLDVRIEAALHVNRLRIVDRAVFVQAESLHNVSSDSGYQAFTWVAHPRTTPQNAFTMIPFQTNAPRDTPITIAGSVRLAGGEWDAWVLSDVGPREHDHLRGRLVMSVDGTDAGAFDAVADDITVAMMEVEPH